MLAFGLLTALYVKKKTKVKSLSKDQRFLMEERLPQGGRRRFA